MAKGILYIRGLPAAVKTLFKTTCARRDDNMTAVIEALMRKYIEQPGVVSDQLVRVKVEKRQRHRKPGRAGRPPNMLTVEE